MFGFQDRIIFEKNFKITIILIGLRDLTGIFKLTFAVMLFSDNDELVLLASAGLVILMLGAFGTHMRVKNGPRWFMPSLSQIIMNGYIFYMTY